MLSLFGEKLVQKNGDRVALSSERFKGRCVLVCCFQVPVIASESWSFRSLVSLCEELYSIREDFEMIIVVQMNSLADDEEIFNLFFSGFPDLSLAVPFEDKERRDSICKMLSLGHDQDCFKCLLIDGEGQVSPPLNFNVMWEYGAEAFPFNYDILSRKDQELCDMIFKKKSCLESVLRCNDSSPECVHKLNHPLEKKSISQLSNEVQNKYFGLFLCSQGREIKHLLNMYNKCKGSQSEFEVIVVYMPCPLGIDPSIFQGKMHKKLLKVRGVSEWWCLPFNNSVSRRFWRLTRYYNNTSGNNYFDMCDKLVMVGPNVDHLDMYGFDMMGDYGIDAFPFTVDAFIKKTEEELRRGVTLESLFVSDEVSVFRGSEPSDSMKLRQLFQGNKNIIICISSLYSPFIKDFDYERLAVAYNRTKDKKSSGDFEMVFVEHIPEVDIGEEKRSEIRSKMPWYICHLDTINDPKMQQLKEMTCSFTSALVGFRGKRKRICSVRDVCWVTADPKAKVCLSLGDTLYEDAERLLGYHLYIDHRMERFKYPQPRNQ